VGVVAWLSLRTGLAVAVPQRDLWHVGRRPRDDADRGDVADLKLVAVRRPRLRVLLLSWHWRVGGRSRRRPSRQESCCVWRCSGGAGGGAVKVGIIGLPKCGLGLLEISACSLFKFFWNGEEKKTTYKKLVFVAIAFAWHYESITILSNT
jgi:hypothetical protein